MAAPHFSHQQACNSARAGLPETWLSVFPRSCDLTEPAGDPLLAFHWPFDHSTHVFCSFFFSSLSGIIEETGLREEHLHGLTGKMNKDGSLCGAPPSPSLPYTHTVPAHSLEKTPLLFTVTGGSG